MSKRFVLLLVVTVCIGWLDLAKGEYQKTPKANITDRAGWYCPNYIYECRTEKGKEGKTKDIMCVPYYFTFDGCDSLLTIEQLIQKCKNEVSRKGEPPDSVNWIRRTWLKCEI